MAQLSVFLSQAKAMCSAFGAVLTEEALVKGRDPLLGRDPRGCACPKLLMLQISEGFYSLPSWLLAALSRFC